MRKVAVLGCSYSAAGAAEGEPWAKHIANNFDIIVHNYAQAGHSTLYIDYMLKYIATMSDETYDAVIVQLPPAGRWYLPSYRTNNKMFVSIKDGFIFKQTEDTRYYDVVDTHGKIVLHSSGHHAAYWYCEEQLQKEMEETDFTRYFSPMPVAYDYSEMFAKTLPMYKKFFKNLFFYTHSIIPDSNCITNNIGYSSTGLDRSVEKFMKKKYGEEGFLKLTRYYANDNHFSPYGNRILYEEYILPSKIGSWLRGEEND